MSKRDVADALIEVLKEVQILGGHSWVDLPPGDAVIGTLAGFDSLTGVEATVLIERKLANKLGRAGLSFKLNSVFVSDDGRKALCLREIVSKVCALLEAA
jgi:hypothetical protein